MDEGNHSQVAAASKEISPESKLLSRSLVALRRGTIQLPRKVPNPKPTHNAVCARLEIAHLDISLDPLQLKSHAHLHLVEMAEAAEVGRFYPSRCSLSLRWQSG